MVTETSINTSIYREDVLFLETVGGHHAVDESSSNCTICGNDDFEYVYGRYQDVDSTDVDDQWPVDTLHKDYNVGNSQQTTSMNMRPTYNHGGNDSDLFNSTQDNGNQKLNIGCRALDLSSEANYYDAKAIDLTVPRLDRHLSLRHIASPSLLPTLVNTKIDNGMERLGISGDRSLTLDKVFTPQLLLLNGRSHEIVSLGGGVWMSKIEYEMKRHF